MMPRLKNYRSRSKSKKRPVNKKMKMGITQKVPQMTRKIILISNNYKTTKLRVMEEKMSSTKIKLKIQPPWPIIITQIRPLMRTIILILILPLIKIPIQPINKTQILMKKEVKTRKINLKRTKNQVSEKLALYQRLFKKRNPHHQVSHQKMELPRKRINSQVPPAKLRS